jgi:sulfate permease, SulP family
MSLVRLNLTLFKLWHQEFQGYSLHTFQRDLLAGLTVGAVALPLALAFGVSSGATPAAGLVTAIVAGLVIAVLGGSSSQISGPTGAMSAILVGLASQYGLSGIWGASIIAGVLLVLLGMFRLGLYVVYIPSSVITGFTLGIALIIAIGQLDNILGITMPHANGDILKLIRYTQNPIVPNWRTITVALIVVATMIVWPRITSKIPASLVGIIIATMFTQIVGWNIPVIGEIPTAIVLDQRLTLSTFEWSRIPELISPGITIAALGAIESLLCGAVAKNMTGKSIDNNQELIAQGIGNIIIPFFGGVPATAAIARSSVAIKSGGISRLVSIVHSIVLVLSIFLLGSVIGKVPLATLGGVLIVTAWRMNEWETISFAIRTRFMHVFAPIAITALATVFLDLTQAILIGTGLSSLIYLVQSGQAVEVVDEAIELDLIQQADKLGQDINFVKIYQLVGPLFFGSVSAMMQRIELLNPNDRTVVLDMQGVPLIDVMGIKVLEHFVNTQQQHGGDVLLANIQPKVYQVLERGGFIELFGDQHVYKSTSLAVRAALQKHVQTGSLDGATLLPFTNSEAMIEAEIPSTLINP